ncbi:cytochrome c biogenesis protein ResB [candidate division KSB1 bacterium]|nr:cytochrome c biogenesis protein ResB [candidate division KSB1 bacterium]
MAEKSDNNLFNRIYKNLASIKFAIVLIILLGIFSLIAIMLGEYFPTNFMNWDKMYIQKMGIFKFEMLKFFGVFNPYHSFWYKILLFLLVLNILICTLERTKGSFKLAFQPSIRKTPDSIKNLNQNATLKSNSNPAHSLEKVKQFLSAQKYKIHENSDDKIMTIFANRGGVGRIGYVFFHYGLIAVLVGGLIISMYGQTETKWGSANSLIKPTGADFSVRVDDFQIQTNDRGQVKDYLATLTVLDTIDGQPQEMFQKVVEVNFPLRYKGYTFYQSSYNSIPGDLQSIFVKIKQTQPVVKDTIVTIKLREKASFPQFNCTLTIMEFFPYYQRAGDSVYNASMEPKNPAIYLQVERPDTLPVKQWLFQKFPEFHKKQTGNLTFQLMDFHFQPGQLFTGLQVSRKPGSELVWIGIIAMTLGLVLAFYLFHRRLWVVIEDGANNTSKIFIGGNINKNQEGFKSEFKELLDQLKIALK